MPRFEVIVTRTQIQHASFIVEAESEDALDDQLGWVEETDLFSDIDGRFDEGEVDSIDYEITNVEECTAKMVNLPVDNDLQELLNESNTK